MTTKFTKITDKVLSSCYIKRVSDNRFLIKSANGTYTLSALTTGSFACSCPGYFFRKTCKHSDYLSSKKWPKWTENNRTVGTVNYTTLVSLLTQLRDLVINGRGKSIKAYNLRDKLDLAWRSVTKKEMIKACNYTRKIYE